MELSQEEVRQRSQLLVDRDFAALRQRYLAENGTILDSDRAKELFPDYAINVETRRKYSSAVYPAAADFIDRLFERLVRDPIPSDKKKLVVFTAGGPGSGKSAVITSTQDVFPLAALIMDGTLSNEARALRQISCAQAMGYRVQVIFVYRPLMDCLRGVWARAMSQQSARATPFRIVIDKHDGALATFRKLRSTLNNPVTSYLCYRFIEPNQPTVPITWIELEQVPIYDIATAVKMAHIVLNECEFSAAPGLRFEAQSLRAILAAGLG